MNISEGTEGPKRDVAWRGPSGEHELGLAKLSSLSWSCRGFIKSHSIQIYRDFDENRRHLLMLFSKITGDNSGICGVGSWFDVDWQARADFLSPNCGDLPQRGYFS